MGDVFVYRGHRNIFGQREVIINLLGKAVGAVLAAPQDALERLVEHDGLACVLDAGKHVVYATQEAVKFIAGARPLSEFDQFVEEMNEKGAQKIIDAYNEWYLNK